MYRACTPYWVSLILQWQYLCMEPVHTIYTLEYVYSAGMEGCVGVNVHATSQYTLAQVQANIIMGMCVHAYIGVHVFSHVCVCMDMCANACLCVCVCVCVCIYTWLYVHKNVQKQTHTIMHLLT